MFEESFKLYIFLNIYVFDNFLKFAWIVASSRRSVSQGAAREKKNRGERKRKNGFFRFLTPRFPALFFRTEPQLTEHLEESIAAVS